MVACNYAIATQCYSFRVLRRKLINLIHDSISCGV
jgi:hypothetical protein